MNNRTTATLAVLAGFLILMGCLVVACIGVGGYYVVRYVLFPENTPAAYTTQPPPSPTFAPTKGNPTGIPNQPRTPEVELTPTNISPASQASQDTLKTLEQSEVPYNDPLELAKRLQGITGVSKTIDEAPPNYQVGAEAKFWVLNSVTNESVQVTAALAYITPHAYFWIEKGVDYNPVEVKNLVEAFENKIYPTDREFFGSEWTPGIDNDVHLYMLYTRGLGGNVAGYYSSADEINPKIRPTSNAHEMFFINADNTYLSEEFIYAVLAHEFQHMIHWYRDPNEIGWLNEGFSELAAFLNGYGVGGHDWLFAQNPDIQLDDWPNDKNLTTPHYGASFLFLDYFLNRFGEKATQAVVSNPDHGLKSMDEVLQKLNEKDPTTGKPVTIDDVFADWVLANYLKDPKIGDGRFTYQNFPDSPQTGDTGSISQCPKNNYKGTVNQYGVNYLRITCRGNFTLQFQGATQANLIPEQAHSGQYAYWSNKGDESDMMLTHDFDFSKVSGPLQISYWMWYDLEKDYDFVYLEASTDGGQSWKIIKTPACTTNNISGNNYGCGYNDVTNGWQQETVDLSSYAGKNVSLRFEYITDAAVNGEGFLLDDVSIPQINYSTDFETDSGGWQGAGFVRVEPSLPQTYRVSIIHESETPSVEYLTLGSNNSIDIPLDLSDDVVLVISGTTRFTRIPATYTLSIR